MIANAPYWITPKGFLFTATELITNSRTITATNASSYLLLNGSFPPGMTITTNTGVISGQPNAVLNLEKYQFTIRASNTITSVDRNFSIDVQGSDAPIWNTITLTTSTVGTIITSTTIGYLPLGPQKQPYILNKQYVDFQFTANAVQSPANTKIKYFIPDQGGFLPPNLNLNENGKLTGIIDCFTSTDTYVGTTTNLVNSTVTIYAPKEYQFYITASDSVRNQSRLFKIVTVDPTMLQYWKNNSTTAIDILNVSMNTQPYNWLQSPQFIQSTDLGTIRAENYHLIPITAYDPIPLIGSLTYSIITGTTVTSKLPQNLKLDKNQGYIYGYVPYQPAYTRSYKFIVKAEKTYGTLTTSTTGTFYLKVKGVVENTITWITTSSLGSILEGQISELSLKAEQTESGSVLKYNKVIGNLPSGLTFQTDGTITGKVAYNTSGTYIFTASVANEYDQSAIEKKFDLTVIPVTPQYTEIYIKSFLPNAKKQAYLNFINDEKIFDPKLIYRYYDKNFGIQSDLKITLEFGLQKISLSNFYPALNTNFYRRRFYFGEIKLVNAVDSYGNILYELIYADVLDLLSSNNQPSALEISMNSETYYPAGLDNMKYRLKNIVLNNLTTISVNTDYNPKFFQNLNASEQDIISYIKYIPICYANPGQGKKILNRIKFSKFDFKALYIETDRLIVKDNLTVAGEKYVFFTKNTIKS